MLSVRTWGRADIGAAANGIMSVFEVRLDADHPTPLYHQIATAIRWKIGTGALRPGALLPPMRAAAEAWRVSYHTVRRAYGQLARDGHVRTRRGDGTRVLAGEPGRRDRPDVGIEQFVEEFVAAGRQRFALDAEDLARLVERVGAAREAWGEGVEKGPAAGGSVIMVECNDQQAVDLAGQIEARWGIRAVPWHLSRDGEPPAGRIIGTRFHQAEMLSHWPHREQDMRFVALRVDPDVVRRIRDIPVRPGGLVLVERDVGTGHQHLADLAAVLPEAAEAAVVTDLPDAAQLRCSEALYVIAPRLWDLLEEDVRADARVVLIRHVFNEADARTLGEELERV
jgi:DNA-binding transcriptional regulator YhcF (GntR family)